MTAGAESDKILTIKQRTESRQFLAWFLENYYRLDPMEVSDSICDGRFDKGVDGVYVNDHLGEIHIFQADLAHGKKTLGDTSLKEFAGTVSQFDSKASVENLINTCNNPALVSLLKANDVANKVDEGYSVHGVFLTNAPRDDNAIAFLKHSKIKLFDEGALQRGYVSSDKSDPIGNNMTFDISGVPCIDYQLDKSVKMVIAPLSAQELVGMQGIVSGELFAWNVRQYLRRTKVNKDIEKSIKTLEDHQLFPAFHNGITILCDRLDVLKDKIAISGYAVVNGCQSLTSLYENRKDVSKDLRIITKLLNVSPTSELAEKITNRTNTQNGITFRDLQSNNPIQVRLQSEIHRNYSNQLFYRIKRGEHLEWDDRYPVIENELAASILLAFDLKQPWSCHQRYKLFDELHAAIFGRPEVNADRIVLAYDIYNAVVEQIDLMKNELFGKYNLTSYTIIYLLREAIETDQIGKELCTNPSKFLAESRESLDKALRTVVKDIVTCLDNEATAREGTDGEYFDYKTELKSPRKVAELRKAVITSYQTIVRNRYTPSFSSAWDDALKTVKKAKKK